MLQEYSYREIDKRTCEMGKFGKNDDTLGTLFEFAWCLRERKVGEKHALNKKQSNGNLAGVFLVNMRRQRHIPNGEEAAHGSHVEHEQV